MKKSKGSISNKNPDQKAMGSAVRAESELTQEVAELNWLDYILAPIAAALAAIWVFQYVGTSIEWDDLFYMNVSHYTTPQAWVLNRFWHIYLQKFFMWLAGDALAGAKAYWCFLFFSTCVLV